MLVREFMRSPAVMCNPDATLQDASRKMEQHNVGSLVIIGDDGHLLGMLTDRDIALKAVARGFEPTTSVSDVMSKMVVTISPDADVFEATRTMARWGVRRVPVVAGCGTVSGIITLDDVTAAMSDEMGLLRTAVSTQMSGGPAWDET